MNKYKSYIYIVLTLFTFILIHNPLIIFLSNINTLFREDNRENLKNFAYEEKIEYLEKKLSDYELETENLKLYEDQNYILSKIAIRDIYDFYDYLIISTKTMAEKGKPVINENGLVGIVESSNKKTAKVKLITGKVKISVKVSDSYGLLDEYDKENNLFIIHNINNYKEIKIGDEVVTSGLSDLPFGIPIGTVEKTDKKGIEQIVYVKSKTDFDKLNYLYVIN